MIANQHARKWSHLYLAVVNYGPIKSSKPRLTRADLVLYVSGAVIAHTPKNTAATSKSIKKTSTPQELAQVIHSRFLAETGELPDPQGITINLHDELPKPEVINEACKILAGLGYVARPHIINPLYECDEPLVSVWIKHADF